VDVNGLKTTNDTQGHPAGDDLLRDVAATLKDLGDDKLEVYRVGGDEFMVIATDTDKEDFAKLKEILVNNCERPNRAHFAVGACHSDDVDGSIIKAMQTADATMYEVKEEYYSRHPEYEWHNKPVG
jgi:diguanylate cyclase (GGDEF)-like protein